MTKVSKGEFRNLLAIIRLAVLDERSLVTFSKKKYKYTQLLKILQMQGFIESYEERGEIIILKLKHTYWKNFSLPMQAFSEISQLTRMRRKDTINSRDLYTLNRLKGQHESYFISSDKGILTGLEISKKFIGGIPLFQIK